MGALFAVLGAGVSDAIIRAVCAFCGLGLPCLVLSPSVLRMCLYRGFKGASSVLLRVWLYVCPNGRKWGCMGVVCLAWVWCPRMPLNGLVEGFIMVCWCPNSMWCLCGSVGVCAWACVSVVGCVDLTPSDGASVRKVLICWCVEVPITNENKTTTHYYACHWHTQLFVDVLFNPILSIFFMLSIVSVSVIRSKA